MEGFITHHQNRRFDTENVIGFGEQKYGRKSLRSELMTQILEGVETQMEKMHEEEILIKIGEKKREASSVPEINTTFRDLVIGSWLTKRKAAMATQAHGMMGPPDGMHRTHTLGALAIPAELAAKHKAKQRHLQAGGNTRVDMKGVSHGQAYSREAPLLHNHQRTAFQRTGAVFDPSPSGEAQAYSASHLPKSQVVLRRLEEARNEVSLEDATQAHRYTGQIQMDEDINKLQRKLVTLQQEREQLRLVKEVKQGAPTRIRRTAKRDKRVAASQSAVTLPSRDRVAMTDPFYPPSHLQASASGPALSNSGLGHYPMPSAASGY